STGGQYNLARLDFAAVGCHPEMTIRALDANDLGARFDLQFRLLRGSVETLEQVLFRDDSFAEIPEERKAPHLGHDDLLARVAEDRATQRLLVEYAEREPLFLEPKRSGKAGRASADDHHICHLVSAG